MAKCSQINMRISDFDAELIELLKVEINADQSKVIRRALYAYAINKLGQETVDNLRLYQHYQNEL